MAKIIGNTTSTPNPQPNWTQTDSTKADYIKNKPDILTEEDIIEIIGNNGGGGGGSGGSSAVCTTETITLDTDAWVDLTYAYSFPGMTADALVEVAIAADPAMMEEACRCGVYCAEQGENVLTFKAMYERPTIDINVIIKVTI